MFSIVPTLQNDDTFKYCYDVYIVNASYSSSNEGEENNENNLTVNVNVAAPEVTLVADNTQIELEAGKEVRIAIKEVTTTPDGTATERDVTAAAKYTPGDKALITVNSGLVRAKKAGNTTITVKYGKNELTLNVNITEASIRSIVPGSETVTPSPELSVPSFESIMPDAGAIPVSA